MFATYIAEDSMTKVIFFLLQLLNELFFLVRSINFFLDSFQINGYDLIETM